MPIIQTKCKCGEPIEIRSDKDTISTMRRDGKQAVYPADVNKNYSIFRCNTCLQPLHKTVSEFQYVELDEALQAGNTDNFYRSYKEMKDLIKAKVTDRQIRQDLIDKLTWLKCYFDGYRATQEDKEE